MEHVWSSRHVQRPVHNVHCISGTQPGPPDLGNGRSLQTLEVHEHALQKMFQILCWIVTRAPLAHEEYWKCLFRPNSSLVRDHAPGFPLSICWATAQQQTLVLLDVIPPFLHGAIQRPVCVKLSAEGKVRSQVCWRGFGRRYMARGMPLRFGTMWSWKPCVVL